MDYVGIVFFSDEALARVAQRGWARSRLSLALLLLLSVFLTIFPLDAASWQPAVLGTNFLAALFSLAVLLALTWLAAHVLGLEGDKYHYVTLLAFVLFIRSFAFLASYLAFSNIFGWLTPDKANTIIGLSMTLFIYYFFVLYGWGAESAAELKSWRGPALAIFSILLIFYAYNFVFPLILH